MSLNSLNNTGVSQSADDIFRQKVKKLKDARRALIREMSEFEPDDVCASRLPVIESELAAIKKSKNDYQDSVEDFVEEYTGRLDEPSILDSWKKDVVDIGKKVKSHAKSIRDKREELFPENSTAQKSLKIQEALLLLQQQTLEEKQKSNAEKSMVREADVRCLADEEKNIFFGECSVLEDIMPDEDWTAVDDDIISQNMRSLSKWQEQWCLLERAYRKYENLSLRHSFPQVDKDAVKAKYDDLRDRFDNTKELLQKEDSTVRGLYTLEPIRSDIIKYPTFSGAQSEDYVKFREIMEVRFRENKIKKREQVSKLRECLKGAALARVPDGVKDIEEAFKRLQEAFGNPSKLMSFQLKALEDLGTLPSEKLPSGQYSYSKRIEWLLKLEVILGKIIELSQRSSKLAHEAFSSTTYRKLWGRFPTNVLEKLVKVPGEDEIRMTGILNKIIKMREESQLLDDEFGNHSSTAKKPPDSAPKVLADIFFKAPTYFEECRLCTHLQATGQRHSNLFENHLSNYLTGCPKFIEASTELRKTFVAKLKICKQCFNPDVIVSKEHYLECPFNKKKNAYTCQNKSCKEHMWICLSHKRDNKQAMEKFKNQLQKKGFNLAFASNITLPDDDIAPVQLNQAVRKIRRAEKKRGGEIVSVPEGPPLFLFHAAKGKTAPVMTFYDSGCSHAVFRDGVPKNQLRGHIVAKGPFNIDGVGGLKTVALDEWLVSVPRSDGKKQLIQGLAVPKITSDFPYINLQVAITEIKNDDPSNAVLQNCSVPPTVGGSIDMLLGIKYVSVYPKEVHSLPCGLTIYQSRLASHDGLFNACLGGPHTSFTALAEQAGGTARLLTHFVNGLEQYRHSGPPRISCINMTEEEIIQVRKLNILEGDMEEIAELVNMEETEAVADMVYIEDTDDLHCAEHWDCCSHCPSVHVASDERIRDFKRFQEIHDNGFEVEYRCPKCRDCTDCKKADKIEKISIKEENEMFAIKQSVKLDFAGGKIQCSLPLKGKERDFLSSNRDRALKVLYQQCKKYGGDPDTKKSIIDAFAKLFDNGHAKLMHQLSEEELNQFIHKEVQHNLVWRVVFSGSVTTPSRPVMDASARTAFRKDGSGGKSLNDLVCRGKVDSLNIIKVLMRFLIGRSAFSGDLTQFYNSCKLTPEQWNLQRFLWLKDLDPSGQVLEGVITTLMYGVNSVSAQSEYAMSELATHVKDKDPELAMFLISSRYVDDLLDSKSTSVACQRLINSADELFSKVGLTCKGWTLSGLPPPAKVTKDGLSVGVFGVYSWFSEADVLEQKFSKLHFSKPKRGKLPDSVKFFEGSTVEEMDKFVPNPLSKRQAASKVASVWDPLGKLAPVLAIFKLDIRETFQRTDDWDSPMPPDLRQKWVHNFLMIEKLRGLKFTRAVMPLEAIDTKMRILTGVDAAKELLLMGSWAGFKLKSGGWSNQQILGRSLLARNESIAKSELDALCAGSNMAWVIRLALQDWVDSEILFGDSTIALCWLSSEKLRLNLFHRNRVLQIRRGTCLENVYHVRSENNPADCGTRPSKVKIDDIGQDSRWENGDMWMRLEVSEAVEQGFLKPISQLRITKEIEQDFNEGIVFGDKDELLMGDVQFATVITEGRVQKLQDRANFSNYLVLPTKYSFPSVVRIYGYIICFVTKASKGRKFLGALLSESRLSFGVFSTHIGHAAQSCVKVFDQAYDDYADKKLTLANYFMNKKLFCGEIENAQQPICILDDSFLNKALLYLFRKGAAEVKKFVSPAKILKIAFEVEGILLSKSRFVDGMNFVETGELGNFNLGTLGVKVNTPVLDRYSPLSYSIALHVHWTVGKHKGIETNNRLSLEHVSIIQGMSLFRELAAECIRCHMKRKKFLEVPMGPIAQEQLMVAPPFYTTMIDLFGPLKSYVPGYERQTRNRNSLESKVYIMVAVCITTKIVNLQVLESKSASGIIDGFTRLSCEVGVPSIVHIDQDSGALAGFQSVELEFRDLKHQLWTQFGISFATCPVGGHEQHGLVERVIKSIQESFNDCGLANKRIHAMGWQTFCKLAENSYNNLPIGYSYSRYQDNTELLKILTPNMLRIGRINSRSLQGPIRLPINKKELMEQVELTYQAWFRIFKDTVVPRMISQPKWFRIDKDLKEQDLVYFQKRESELSSPWTIGQVEQVIASKDGFIRRAIVKYFNPGESNPQFTDRSVRKLIKLWSVDDACVFDDLHELENRLAHPYSVAAKDEEVYRQHVASLYCHRSLLSSDMQSYSFLAVSPFVGCTVGSCKLLMEKIFGFITVDGELIDGQFTAACSLDDVLVQTLWNENDEVCFAEEDEHESWQINFADLLMSTNLNLD